MPKPKAFVYVEDRGEGKGYFAKAAVEREVFKDFYGPFHLKNGRVWDTVELAKAFLDKYILCNMKQYDVTYEGVLTDAAAWRLRTKKTHALQGREQLILFQDDG